MNTDFIGEVKRLQRRVGAEDDGKIGPMTVSAIHRVLDGKEIPKKPVTNVALQLDPRTEKNLASLDPNAQPDFRKFTLLAKATAATFGCDYVMISGNRTYAQQTALYAQGRTAPGKIVTNAQAGFSNHNFGIAGDYGVFRGKDYVDSSEPAFAAKVHKACSVHAAECGLEWGGSWKGFKDLPHYEKATGLSMHEKRKRMAARGSVL